VLTDARFEARHQIADLAPGLTLDPVGMNGTISEESRWREPIEGEGAASAGSDIVLSRWTATHGGERTDCSVTPDDCHIVALSLRTTWMSLSTQSKPLFERSLPPGTILVSAPGQRLEMRVTPPFDFLHFHVANRLLRDEGLAPDQDHFVPCEFPLFRDTLAEALGRSLLEEDVHRSQPEYARVVAKAIVMRAIGRQQAKRRCWALPKWRMKRLEQYIALNIDRAISLGDMAATVGLSKMHFAAQFRALTGFRPREYLLFKRIERAKAVMTETGMPLVEVAFAAGFNAQAHFSTVFKRFTGKTPAQWRQECRHAI
jgi:AraC-like DNA-binding protein